MNAPLLIHRMTHRVTASLKPVLKPLFLIGTLLFLVQAPVEAALTPTNQATFNENVSKAKLYAGYTNNYLVAAQKAKAAGNVEGVRGAVNSARIFANLTVTVANQAHAIAPSAEAAVAAHNAVAWANQALVIWENISNTPPPPLPKPRRILVPRSSNDRIENLKNNIGVFKAFNATCCTQINSAGSGFIIGRYAAMTAAHAIYNERSGFYAKNEFHQNPERPFNVSRKIYTAAIQAGFRGGINPANPDAMSPYDIGIGIVSLYSSFTDPLYAEDEPLVTAEFNKDFHLSRSREGVAIPYRSRGFITRNPASGQTAYSYEYKSLDMTFALMTPLPGVPKAFYNSSIRLSPSDFGQGTSGGPLVRERHESGFLWGGYSTYEVVGVKVGDSHSGNTSSPIYCIFDHTDTYFVGYYTTRGPGFQALNPSTLDFKNYNFPNP